jgi:hypothetical protein
VPAGVARMSDRPPIRSSDRLAASTCDVHKHYDPECVVCVSKYFHNLISWDYTATYKFEALQREEHYQRADAASKTVTCAYVNSVLEKIVKIMNRGTDMDGWDIGILDELEDLLDEHGFPVVQCEDL